MSCLFSVNFDWIIIIWALRVHEPLQLIDSFKDNLIEWKNRITHIDKIQIGLWLFSLYFRYCPQYKKELPIEQLDNSIFIISQIQVYE